ncbi:MAG: hypothetical protein MUE40_06510 [Anaerolineae bacterium]|jgi:protein-L-isoaspartate(D-aspartate) O-methyltransferase|nr:hypothetical protein [Anaerolineae bacterium]
MADKVMPDLLRQRLLESLRQQGVMTAPGVEAAFRAVPRHLFLPQFPLDRAYADESVPLKYDAGGLLISSASQPTMMAIMLDQAQLAPGHNVLEIGTASGYNAALMQHIVGPQGHVTSLELEADLAKQAVLHLQQAGLAQVRVVPGDGSQGYAPRAAYDRILSAVGIWDVPRAWLAQMKPEGRLIAPIWVDGVQVSASFSRQPDGSYLSVDNRPCYFVYVRGESAAPPIRQQIGSSSLFILSDDLNRIDGAALHLLLSHDHDLCHLESPLATVDFWNGFQLYAMLNEPPQYIFALFLVIEGQQAYGMDGRGLALITRGSATFAPYHTRGTTHCYGGAEAFLTMQELLDRWNAAQRPDMRALRLRLIPLAEAPARVDQGKLYRRRDHVLHAWLAL